MHRPPSPLHLRRRPLEHIAGDGDRLNPASRVHHATSLSSERVSLPPLHIGATFLELWPVRQEPRGSDWRAGHYDSLGPAVFVLGDALVHSSAGIIGIGGDVIEETLAHTAPDHQGFAWSEDGIVLAESGVTSLSGSYITVLAGAPANYFHAVVEGVLRLASVPPHLLHGARGVLYPADGVCQEAMLRLMGLPEHLVLRPVAAHERLRVERLVYPVSVGGNGAYHSCVAALFDRMSAHVPGPGSGLPRRFYLERGPHALRRLLGEAELAQALRPLGFVPVRPERMTLEDQIRLFRDAEAIVAPHGAGLTNLGFCRPGCQVLELQMDAYVNWCFRHLAALRGLPYDCVLGRATGAWTGNHALTWNVPAQHVVAAARHMLGE